MEITHLGHASVLVELAGKRILIDPGNFSDRWHGLTDLDAVVVTHLHPDHVDPEHVPALLAANPDAQVFVEPGVPKTLEIAGATPIGPDATHRLGEVTLSTVGGRHAVIHRDIPMIGNVGVILEAEGEPRFFHPGDSLATCPRGIDVLALPAMGPWAAMKEHVDFCREVGAPKAFPVHDGLINERGFGLVVGRMNELTDTEVVDFREKGAQTI
ncbi:MBL fold metallo-hydrolase [Mariniluteicoccus flavus]